MPKDGPFSMVPGEAVNSRRWSCSLSLYIYIPVESVLHCSSPVFYQRGVLFYELMGSSGCGLLLVSSNGERLHLTIDSSSPPRAK